MRKNLMICFLALAISDLAGCRTSPANTAWENTLIASTLFQEIRMNSTHPGWMVESEDDEEIILAVGNTGPERFDKWRDVKIVKNTGELFELEYRYPEEDAWIPLKPAAKSHERIRKTTY